MDATRSPQHIRNRTVAGLAAVAGLVTISFAVGRCTAPAAAAEPAINEPAVEVSIDTIGSGASRIADAEVAIAAAVGTYLDSITATTDTMTPPAPVTLRVMPVEEPTDGSRWDQLAQCESGGNWGYPPVAGGFSGGIMFHIGTWHAMGGGDYAPDAYLATREQQIVVAERTLAVSGWGAWPGCSRKFGWL